MLPQKLQIIVLLMQEGVNRVILYKKALFCVLLIRDSKEVHLNCWNRHLQWNQESCARTGYFTDATRQVARFFLSRDQNTPRQEFSLYVDSSVNKSRVQVSWLHWTWRWKQINWLLWTLQWMKHKLSVSWHTVHPCYASCNNRTANLSYCSSLKVRNQFTYCRFAVSMTQKWQITVFGCSCFTRSPLTRRSINRYSA